jgi:alkanesulfonate monooxygenase SsuD/methylene tetrahydromethanopterin reductase-like flavin-dependent oxidoreductase (luciferase family)
MLIGGGGEKKTLRYTAEFADIWHGFGQPDVIRHKNEVLDQHCRDIGRDPSEIERSCGVSPTKIELGDEMVAAGASLVTLGMDGRSGYDMSPVADWLAWRDERNSG